MLTREAAWVRSQLDVRPVSDLSPLLSIGSGTASSRARQPWIDALVFAPLRARGVEVWHHERDAAPGVDVHGDLADPTFLESLAALGARSVLCANVLEHVVDPHRLADALTSAFAPDGVLLVTVPHRYPYHPDPLDTMLRPSLSELVALFPSLALVAGDEVACESLLRYAVAVRGKRTAVANGVRAVRKRRDKPAPGAPPATAQGASPLRFLLRRTAVTCGVFQHRS